MKDLWDRRYSETFEAYGTEPNDFVRAFAARIPEGPVLCLAGGEGRDAVFVAKLGHDVTTVDLSEVATANALKLAEAQGVQLTAIAADLGEWELGEEQWAGIVSVWAHVPPPVRKRVHASCVRALLPSGVLILEAYTPRQLERPGRGGPPVAEAMMTPEGLRQELAGLTFERCEEVDRDVDEGRYHHGPSTTVQVLATKPT
ncbi:MAG: class I SAM-dependent methyltransferase [Myxococcota bacterium]